MTTITHTTKETNLKKKIYIHTNTQTIVKSSITWMLE